MKRTLTVAEALDAVNITQAGLASPAKELEALRTLARTVRHELAEPGFAGSPPPVRRYRASRDAAIREMTGSGVPRSTARTTLMTAAALGSSRTRPRNGVAWSVTYDRIRCEFFTERRFASDLGLPADRNISKNQERHIMSAQYGPHDIRGWTADDILLGVYAGAELWNSTSVPNDPADALNDRQRMLLDRAADAMPGEDDESDDKVAALRSWHASTLALTLRAAGILWQSTGGADPYDVLSSVQRARLDRAAVLVVTAEDLDRLSEPAGPPRKRLGGAGLRAFADAAGRGEDRCIAEFADAAAEGAEDLGQLAAGPQVTRVRDAEVRVYDAEPGTDDASDMYVLEVLGVLVLVRLVRREDDSESGPYPVRPKIMIEARGGPFTVGVNDIENTYGDAG
jgi:hypothetical protein